MGICTSLAGNLYLNFISDHQQLLLQEHANTCLLVLEAALVQILVIINITASKPNVKVAKRCCLLPLRRHSLMTNTFTCYLFQRLLAMNPQSSPTEGTQGCLSCATVILYSEFTRFYSQGEGTLHRLPRQHYFITNVGTLKQFCGHDNIMPHSEQNIGNQEQVSEGRHHKAIGKCICTNTSHSMRFHPYCYGDCELRNSRALGCRCDTTCGQRVSLGHQGPSTVQLQTRPSPRLAQHQSCVTAASALKEPARSGEGVLCTCASREPPS